MWEICGTPCGIYVGYVCGKYVGHICGIYVTQTLKEGLEDTQNVNVLHSC